MGFLADLIKWGAARWSDAAASGLVQPNGVVAQFPKIFKFPGYKPTLLASLVAGATYTQAGNTVTVTAPGHGLPVNKNGYQIFWPGSAAVPAGMYSGFAYVDGNTFTFSNPVAQTIAAGTAITGTLPYVGSVAVASIVLPGGTLGGNGGISLRFLRSGDGVVASKYWRIYIGGLLFNSCLSTAAASMGIGTMSIFSYGQNTIQGGSFGGPDGTANTAANMYAFPMNMGIDQPLDVRMQLSQASQWIALDAAVLEVIQ